MQKQPKAHRPQAKKVLRFRQVQFLTDKKGRRLAMVLPLRLYEKLLEDISDLAVIAERRNEKTIPHKTFLATL